MSLITRDRAKAVAQFIVPSAIGTTVKLLIKQNVVAEKRYEVAAVYIGSYALGGMAGLASNEWTVAKVDKAADFLAKVKGVTDEVAAQS